MNARAVRLTDVDIDNALSNEHLETVFQPIYSFVDNSLLRHEIFVRWDHPGLGPLPPGAFISFFEAQGRIGDLTRYVLNRALKAYNDWDDKGESGLSLNLTQSDLTDDELAKDIRTALKKAKVDPSKLTLECPSPSPDLSVEEQSSLYTRLAETGCPLSLEVRNRATDTMQALAPFPFTEIKTGGTSILRYARTSRGGPGLSALSDLLAFAKAKKARIVAVGVEEESAAEALHKLGFDAGQGNALGRAGALDGQHDAYTDIVIDDVHHMDEDELAQQILAEPKASDEQASPQEETSSPSLEAASPSLKENTDPGEDSPLDLSEAASTQTALEKSRRARTKAAKQAALRRFKAAREASKKTEAIKEAKQRAEEERAAAIQAADTARKLQERLETSFKENEEIAKGIAAANGGDGKSLEDQVTDYIPATMMASTGLGIGVTANFVSGLRLDGYATGTNEATSPSLDNNVAGAVAPQHDPSQTSYKTDVSGILDMLPSDLVERNISGSSLSISHIEEVPSDTDPATLEPKEKTKSSAPKDAAEDTKESSSTQTAIKISAEDISNPADILDDLVSTSPMLPLDDDAAYADAPSTADEEDAPQLREQKSLFKEIMPPILTRKYRITHFWPRSWKRYQQRRQAFRKDAELSY